MRLALTLTQRLIILLTPNRNPDLTPYDNPNPNPNPDPNPNPNPGFTQETSPEIFAKAKGIVFDFLVSPKTAASANTGLTLTPTL